MKNKLQKNERATEKPVIADVSARTINVAIAGGGKACKYILEVIRNDPFPFLDINIAGICDITKIE